MNAREKLSSGLEAAEEVLRRVNMKGLAGLRDTALGLKFEHGTM